MGGSDSGHHRNVGWRDCDNALEMPGPSRADLEHHDLRVAPGRRAQRPPRYQEQEREPVVIGPRQLENVIEAKQRGGYADVVVHVAERAPDRTDARRRIGMRKGGRNHRRRGALADGPRDTDDERPPREKDQAGPEHEVGLEPAQRDQRLQDDIDDESLRRPRQRFEATRRGPRHRACAAAAAPISSCPSAAFVT